MKMMRQDGALLEVLAKSVALMLSSLLAAFQMFDAADASQDRAGCHAGAQL
jgi:hypothetical protein